jgi:hypothetical protein
MNKSPSSKKIKYSKGIISPNLRYKKKELSNKDDENIDFHYRSKQVVKMLDHFFK